MIIPPKYQLTVKISQYLQRITAIKSIIDTITIVPEVETTIRRENTLKSSLFSARIEGNPLTLNDLPHKTSSDLKKREVFNILKGIEQVHKHAKKPIKQSDILKLHAIVMNGLVTKDTTGHFRKEPSAIFNTGGIAVYMPPLPGEINKLIDYLLNYINSETEPFIPVRAALSHYIFEKIHPFLDGNGRVGRLLMQLVLEKGEFGMKGLSSIEEYLDSHRSEYYDALSVSGKDVTEYVEFMLKALAQTAEEMKATVSQKQNPRSEDFLLPRRAEILQIIREQKLINLDSIKRRFLKVNERTLRYDLKKLIDAKLIRKRGTTRGVYYEAID